MNVTRRGVMQIVTLTGDALSFQLRLHCCPMCWASHQIGDRVVWPGKGISSVCLRCAAGIAETVERRNCARPACPETFAAEGKRRYCSNACRQAHYRERQLIPLR